MGPETDTIKRSTAIPSLRSTAGRGFAFRGEFLEKGRVSKALPLDPKVFFMLDKTP